MMINETLNPITFEQILTGVEFSQSTIVALIGLSLAIAFGISYGFNLIYNQDKLKRFREYRKALKTNFIFQLRKISLDTSNFEENLDKFIEEWQNTQAKVINIYDNILKWRMSVLIIFLLSTLAYFNRLLLPTLYVFSIKISIISNLIFGIGIFILIIFGVLVLKFEKNLAKYELDKPDKKEEMENLISRVFKKSIPKN